MANGDNTDDMDTLQQIGEATATGDTYREEARRAAQEARELASRQQAYSRAASEYQRQQQAFGKRRELFSETYGKYVKRTPREARGTGYAFGMGREVSKDDRALGALFKRYTGEGKAITTRGKVLKSEYTGLVKEQQAITTAGKAVKARYEKAATKAREQYLVSADLVKGLAGEYGGTQYVYDISAGQTRPLSPFEEAAADIDPKTGIAKGVLAPGITDTSDPTKYVPPEIYGYPDFEGTVTYIDEGGRPVSYDPSIKPLPTVEEKAVTLFQKGLPKIDWKAQDVKKPKTVFAPDILSTKTPIRETIGFYGDPYKTTPGDSGVIKSKFYEDYAKTARFAKAFFAGEWAPAEKKVSEFVKTKVLKGKGYRELFPILSKDYDRGMANLKWKAQQLKAPKTTLAALTTTKTPIRETISFYGDRYVTTPGDTGIIKAKFYEDWYKASKASGAFLSGMFEGAVEKPLTTAASFGIGYGVSALGRGVTTLSKGAVVMLGKSTIFGRAGYGATQVLLPLFSATSATAKLGIGAWYGATKVAELKASKDPWRTAGVISTTELAPFVAGGWAGYASAKRAGITRKELMLESKFRALSDPTGATFKRTEKVWDLVTKYGLWRKTVKPGGRGKIAETYLDIRKVFPELRLTKKAAKDVATLLSGSSLAGATVGGSASAKALIGTKIPFKQLDTLKIKVDAFGQARFTGKEKMPSDIDYFVRGWNKNIAKQIEVATGGRLATDVHPFAERLLKPFSSKPQKMKTKPGRITEDTEFVRITKLGEQMAGTAEGMTQAPEAVGLIQKAAFKFLRTDLFIKPTAPKLSPKARVAKYKKGEYIEQPTMFARAKTKLKQAFYPGEFYRLPKDYPSTVTAAEALAKFGRPKLSKTEQAEALKLINQLKIDMGSKQFGSPDKPPDIIRASVYKKPALGVGYITPKYFKSPKVTKSVTKQLNPSKSLRKSLSPSPSKSMSPSPSKSMSPSKSPSKSPSRSYKPYKFPSMSPSRSPSRSPSKSPSYSPSKSMSPSPSKSYSPSKVPPRRKPPTLLFKFDRQKTTKKKLKKQLSTKARKYHYTPSLVGLTLKPTKGKAPKQFSGFEVRRIKI